MYTGQFSSCEDHFGGDCIAWLEIANWCQPTHNASHCALIRSQKTFYRSVKIAGAITGNQGYNTLIIP